MNKKLLRTQQRFFSTKNTKRNEIEKWIKEINQLNQKSIYDLTWKGFYKELQRLGIRRFLNQYGFSHKRQLQQTVARSGLSQKNLSLYDFEGATEQILFYHLGSGFLTKLILILVLIQKTINYRPFIIFYMVTASILLH